MHFVVKVSEALTPALKVGVVAVPSAPPSPCSYAYGKDFVQEDNLSGGPHAFFPIPQEVPPRVKGAHFPPPVNRKNAVLETLFF